MSFETITKEECITAINMLIGIVQDKDMEIMRLEEENSRVQTVIDMKNRIV